MFFMNSDLENTQTEKTNNSINYSEEVIANNILNSSGIDYNDVPINIDGVLRNYEFGLGVTEAFAQEDIVAGIAYSNKEQKQLQTNKFFIFKKSISIRDRRYLMAIAIVTYVMESKNKYFHKMFYSSDLSVLKENENNSNIYRIARAVLMPQKSLSTLLMSPLINNLDRQEKIDSVAKAFLVSNDIAKKRMIETGLI